MSKSSSPVKVEDSSRGAGSRKTGDGPEVGSLLKGVGPGFSSCGEEEFEFEWALNIDKKLTLSCKQCIGQ